MTLIKRLALPMIGLLLTLPIVPAEGASRLEADLQELKLRLTELEQGLAAVRRGGVPQQASSPSSVANLQAGLDNLRVEVQQFAGQVEDMVRENARLKEELSLLREEFSVKVSAIEGRLAALEGKGPVAPPVKSTTPETPATPTTQPESTPEVRGSVQPPAPETGAATLYEASLQLIQKDGKYAAGEKGMRDFLKQYGNHKLAVNAMYWAGEALYGQKKYEDAILQFQDVILTHGDHPKVAAAYLKQAKAFQVLGDQASYRATLQKLIDRFPLSAEADKAKAALKK